MDTYRCAHCGETKPLGLMFHFKPCDPSNDPDFLACSTKCYLAIMAAASQTACVYDHGGHPATERVFWFTDPDGVEHFKTKCTECFADAGPGVRGCPTNHASARTKWAALSAPARDAHLQAVDPLESWLCDDCDVTLSRGEVAAIAAAVPTVAAALPTIASAVPSS